MVQDLLADAQVLRGDLQQLVLCQELQAALQAQLADGDQAQSVVGAGRTGVGQVLGLADVHVHILAGSGVADDHALVHLLAGAHQQGAALLSVEQTVGDGLAGLKADQRTGGAVGNHASPDIVTVEDLVDDAFAVGIGQELVAVAEQAAAGHPELQADTVSAQRLHLLQDGFALAQTGHHSTLILGGNVDDNMLHGLVGLAVDDLGQNVRGRDLQLIAFAAHGLDEDGQMHLTTAHDTEGIGGGGILHLQSDVLQQLFLQTVTDLAAGDILALTAGQRAVVDGEGHLDGGVVDLHEGQRLHAGGAAQGVADGDVRQAGEGHDVACGDVVAGLTAIGLEVIQLGQTAAHLQVGVVPVAHDHFLAHLGNTVLDIQNGVAKVGEEVVVCDWHNPDLKMRGRLTKLYDFQANGRQPCDNITAGDIVAFSGLPDVTIGNTLCSPSSVEPLPFVKINDPTVEMTFSVNDSPLAGREGKYVTSRQIRDRLQKELLKDVALKVEDSATTDSFRVMGRGEMHLSILIETMRREGYELQVSPPHVLTKVIDGKTYEPMEHVVIDVPTQYQGAVMTGLGQRKAVLQQMESLGTDRVRLEFRMPSRGLFGYRNQFLTDTHGEGIINQIFDGYDVWAGMIANRSTGSLVSFETGEAVTYGLFNAQQRGTLLVGPGEKVYEGMVIGYTASGEDVDVNVCKTKHLTNTRSSGSDDALRLIPISKLSLEGCLEFLAQDELLEVTPENLRIRKQILNHEQRMKAKSRMK